MLKTAKPLEQLKPYKTAFYTYICPYTNWIYSLSILDVLLIFSVILRPKYWFKALSLAQIVDTELVNLAFDTLTTESHVEMIHVQVKQDSRSQASLSSSMFQCINIWNYFRPATTLMSILVPIVSLWYDDAIFISIERNTLSSLLFWIPNRRTRRTVGIIWQLPMITKYESNCLVNRLSTTCNNLFSH